MVHAFRGKSPRIHPTVFQVPSAVVIGDVEIGRDASLWFNVVVRGDVNWIKIGEGTNIQDGSILHVTKKTPLTVGNNVTVGHGVTLHGCTIRDNVLVGMRATVMDDVEIGEESLIAAGALVTPGTKVPARSLVIGSPAKVKRPLNADELALIRKGAENYKQYVTWYREEGGF
jgi:carbonic anhydrase/acetyltransferase-like protein (isoleucine patch superfamily)